MNRYNKELKNKYNKIVENMNEVDKKNYDYLLSLQESFDKLVSELQVRLFPEEFDFYYDDGVDAKNRGRGKNPMREEYIKKMDEKRVKLGFQALRQNGYPIDSNDTKQYCIDILIGKIEYPKEIF